MYDDNPIDLTDNIELKPADLCELESATILPMAAGSNPGNVKGGVISTSLKSNFHQGRWGPIHKAQSHLEVVTDTDFLRSWSGKLSVKRGKYLFGGPIFKNFGHFLAECIHRTWAYELQSQTYDVSYAGVVFLPQCAKKLNFIQKYNYKLPPVFIEVLGYLGIPAKKIKLQFSASSYEFLDVPEQASYFRSQLPINNIYKSFLIQRERKNGIRTNVSLHKKVYVSRLHFSLRGAYAGESYLEVLFKRNGFHIFYPEQHTLTEQLQTYKGADELVFAEGGALHVLELLGELDASIYIIARRPSCPGVFKAILEARVKKFTFFTSVLTLPSLFIPKQSKRAAHGSALSILKPNDLFDFLQTELSLALDTSDIDKFEDVVHQDVNSYYEYYNMLDTDDELVKAKAIRSFVIQVHKLPSFTQHQFNDRALSLK